jgi:integrase
MARQLHRLNTLAINRLTTPGRHADGGGLYVVVRQTGQDASGEKTFAKTFVFLYRDRRNVKKFREMGLGAFPAVSLAAARKKAEAARQLLEEGEDPLAVKRQAEGVPTFGALAEKVMSAQETQFRNDKHRAQWRATISQSGYAGPLWDLKVSDIETSHVLDVLRMIWTAKAETASRVRGRIEKILDAAKAMGFRSSENPARWRGHLDRLLPQRQKLQRGHHKAMPWQDLPAFIARLRAIDSVSARCLEFVILAAARSGEVLRSKRDGIIMGARWEEIDFAAKIWTVPAVRMKAGQVHRVPLCERVLAILEEMGRAGRDGFIFPGERRDQPLSEMGLEGLMRRMGAKPFTVHGFRSSFRDWAGERTSFPREIAEAALAHTIGNTVEQAYRRGDALERRRELMQAWAQFCEPEKASNVVPLRKA